MSLFVDAQQRLWIATGHERLYRVDTPRAAVPRAVRYTTAEGLASNNIRYLVQDTRGRLYQGASRIEGPAIAPGMVPLRIGFTSLAFGFG